MRNAEIEMKAALNAYADKKSPNPHGPILTEIINLRQGQEDCHVALEELTAALSPVLRAALQGIPKDCDSPPSYCSLHGDLVDANDRQASINDRIRSLTSRLAL